jgi:hypothetical protein
MRTVAVARLDNGRRVPHHPDAPTTTIPAIPTHIPAVPRHVARPDRLAGDLAGNLILTFGWGVAIVFGALALWCAGVSL